MCGIFAKAEISQLKLTILPEQDVFGLDVAMDYFLGMGELQCFENLLNGSTCSAFSEWFAGGDDAIADIKELASRALLHH